MATKRKRTAAEVIAVKQEELKAAQAKFLNLKLEYQEVAKLLQDKNQSIGESAKKVAELEAVIKALGEVAG